MSSTFPASVDLARGFDAPDLHGEVLADLPNPRSLASWASRPASGADERDGAVSYETDALILSSAAGSLW